MPAQGATLPYDRGGLPERIQAALAATGLDAASLTPEVLEPLDQLHVRGTAGTRALAELAGTAGGSRVLDIGGGLGGPARLLAGEFGCDVLVIEPTRGLRDAGQLLTRACGLGDRVRFGAGSGLGLASRDRVFDAVWIQSVAVHIKDKRRLFAEALRVLRPGGRLALHELALSPGADLHPPLFPLPFARSAAECHLAAPETIRAALGAAGFREVHWLDETAETAAWFQARLEAARAHRTGLPLLGLHLLYGPDFALMFQNQLRNFAESRLVAIAAVCERQAEPPR